MTTLTTLSDPAQIAVEIDFLTTHCRGPETVKQTLRSWSRDFARNCWRASEMTRLKQVLDGLVVISHANAVFSLAPEYNGADTDHKGIAADSGGYLTARLLIPAILESADVDNDSKAILAEHVVKKIQYQADQIFNMIKQTSES